MTFQSVNSRMEASEGPPEYSGSDYLGNNLVSTESQEIPPKVSHHLTPLETASFWSRVDVLTDFQCWPWKGRTNDKGYGRFQDGMAHRVAHELVNGPIPDGAIVRHSCDNPPCCNPRHLLTGTALDNATDAVSRGRTNRGERRPNAKLTESDVDFIRRNPNGETLASLARRFKIANSTASVIRAGRSWRHLAPRASAEP